MRLKANSVHLIKSKPFSSISSFIFVPEPVLVKVLASESSWAGLHTSQLGGTMSCCEELGRLGPDSANNGPRRKSFLEVAGLHPSTKTASNLGKDVVFSRGEPTMAVKDMDSSRNCPGSLPAISESRHSVPVLIL